MTIELPAGIADDEEVEELTSSPSPARTYLTATLTLMALIGAWEICARWANLPAWLLPSPSAIADAVADWRWELLQHFLVTFSETLLGFGLAIVVSIPLAVAIVYSPILQMTIYPILLALQSMPKVAIAPLFALWIGFGMMPKILVVFLVSFFPIIVATERGLTSVPPPLMELIRSLSASPLQTFIKIRFPTAMPQIFTGFKIAITLSVIGAVIGEFVGAQSGLGYLILLASSQSRTPLAFGALLCLTVMSILLYYAVELIERLVVPWAKKT